MLVWMLGVAMASEGLFLPDAAHDEALSGEVAVGMGVGDPEGAVEAIPVRHAAFSPVKPLRLELGYGKVLGDAGVMTASARYQVLAGETWAVAPWVGGAWLPDDDPLWTAPNLIITPHTSGSTDGTMRRADEIFLDNLGAWLDGENGGG